MPWRPSRSCKLVHTAATWAAWLWSRSETIPCIRPSCPRSPGRRHPSYPRACRRCRCPHDSLRGVSPPCCCLHASTTCQPTLAEARRAGLGPSVSAENARRARSPRRASSRPCASWRAACHIPPSPRQRSARGDPGPPPACPPRATTDHGAPARLAEQRAARRRGQSVDTGARREEEDTAILAPGQIRGQLRQEKTAEQCPSGAAHPHAAWPGTKDVAALVHLETIRHARVVRRHLQEDAAVGQGAIGTDIKGPQVLVGGIIDVEHSLVRGKGQAIGQREVVHEQGEGPVWCQSIDAVGSQFFAREGGAPPARRPGYPGCRR